MSEKLKVGFNLSKGQERGIIMVNMGNAGFVEDGGGAKIEEISSLNNQSGKISSEDIETIRKKHENLKDTHATIGLMMCQAVKLAAQAEQSNDDLRNFVKHTIMQQGISEKDVEQYVIRLTDGTVVKSDKRE